MSSLKTVLTCCLVLTLVSLGRAADVPALWLPSIFADKMVLQQGKPVPVWGKAAPGAKVAVQFAGQTVNSVADADGRWKAILAPLKINKTEADLIVADGTTTRTIHGVVVGEVWMFSGQSNMAFLMGNILRTPEIMGSESRTEAGTHGKGPSQIKAEQDMANANDPLLRTYRVDNISAERPREDAVTRSGWMEWNKETAPDFAATSYYFAEKLRKELDEPIGMLQCSWGGSSISSWISPAMLRSPALNTFWPEDVPDWSSNLEHGRIYNGMVKPLAPYAIAGFGWYQGETEATDHMNAYIYRYLLPAMIQDWRHLWHDNDLPFFIVQLPPLLKGERWEIVREAQSLALAQPHTAMVPTLDLVPPGDLHPKVKYKVAQRLADLVLGVYYGKNTWPGYPSLDKIEQVGAGTVRVHLKNAGAGLKTIDGKPPTEFQVAGDDHVFKPAAATIDGTSIILKTPDVPKAAAVRYAFVQSPAVNLVSQAGLPLVPFRTDDWPVAGQEMMPQPLTEKADLPVTFDGAALGENKAAPWQPSPIMLEADNTGYYVRAAGNRVRVQMKGFPPRKNLPPSPPVFWTAEPAELDASKGVTFQVTAQVNEIGNPVRGLDLEVGLTQKDGSFRRYLVTELLTRIYTFQNFLGGRVSEGLETHLLRSDLDAQSRVMRIAIRPDGIAQIYDSGRLIGTTSGEIIPKSDLKSYLKFGKTVDYGGWSATIYSAAFDPTGAFAPPPNQTAPSEAGEEPEN